MYRNRSYNILIVGDSRVRGLDLHLCTASPNLNFEVKCIPGGKLDQLMLKAMANLSYYDDIDLVLLIGGINNITRLRYTPSRHATLRYLSREEICDMIMQEMYRVTDRISSISEIPVIIPTLCGMDLSAYAPLMWYRLLPLQRTLDNAVVEINRRIRGLNRVRGYNTPDLAYPVHRCVGRRGRYYSHYLWLADGLHPGQMLLARWATRIIDFCGSNLHAVYYN